MTRVSGNWLDDPAALAVMKMLTDGGHQAYFVGGCVRDALIGRQVSDVDIATGARPDQVMALARASDLHAIPTGIDHGTVTIMAGRPFEVTTFRRDIETDGRRAVVAYADNLEDDARRRDLTINGLYADIEGQVIDPVGGLADLQSGRLRFIGDAGDRIREDHLRALRYFRFYAWFGEVKVGPDPAALAAIAENLSGLETISKERVGSEIKKLLAAPDPAPALGIMAQTGALIRVLPGADPTPIAPLVHLEGDTIAPDPIRRLAALCPDAPTKALRLSRAESKGWAQISGAARQGMPASEAGYRLGAERGLDAVLVNCALMARPMDPDAPTAVADGAAATFPISSSDLRPLNGPELGKRLKDLEAKWVASDFLMSKEQLLA